MPPRWGEKSAYSTVILFNAILQCLQRGWGVCDYEKAQAPGLEKFRQCTLGALPYYPSYPTE